MKDITLEGRVAVITGANQGLGEMIARLYVEAGASVLLCARDEEKLLQVKKQLSSFCKPNQKVEAMRADVSKQKDIDNLLYFSLNAFSQIHILVNNAGIYGPKGRIEDVNWEAWVEAIEINLLGSILVSKAFLPHFRKNKYGKIIQLSGGGATNPLPNLSAYAASKAAVVRFAETLAEEVRGDGIDVNSIAPGALNTRLLDEVLEAGPEKVGKLFYEKSLKQKVDGGVSLLRGAELSVFLASSLSDGITAKLISAVWDPWEIFSEHLEELKNTDIYTLRRITPKDRNMNWGDK